MNQFTLDQLACISATSLKGFHAICVETIQQAHRLVSYYRGEVGMQRQLLIWKQEVEKLAICVNAPAVAPQRILELIVVATPQLVQLQEKIQSYEPSVARVPTDCTPDEETAEFNQQVANDQAHPTEPDFEDIGLAPRMDHDDDLTADDENFALPAYGSKRPPC